MPWATLPMEESWRSKIIEAICKAHGWDYDAPVRDLPPEALEYLLRAPKDERVVIGYRHERGENTYTATFEGLISNLERRYRETESEYIKTELEKFMVSPAVPDLRRQEAPARSARREDRQAQHQRRRRAVGHRGAANGSPACRRSSASASGRSPGSSSRRSRRGSASSSTSGSTT